MHEFTELTLNYKCSKNVISNWIDSNYKYTINYNTIYTLLGLDNHDHNEGKLYIELGKLRNKMIIVNTPTVANIKNNKRNINELESEYVKVISNDVFEYNNLCKVVKYMGNKTSYKSRRQIIDEIYFCILRKFVVTRINGIRGCSSRLFTAYNINLIYFINATNIFDKVIDAIEIAKYKNYIKTVYDVVRSTSTKIEAKFNCTSKLSYNILTQPTRLEEDKAKYWGLQMEWRVLKMLLTCFKATLSHSKQSLNPTLQHNLKFTQISCRTDCILQDIIVNKLQTLIEIKCSYTGYIPKSIKLKDYIQCMTQMACYGIDNCILIYWSPYCYVLWYLTFDEYIWNNIVDSYCNNAKLLEQLISQQHNARHFRYTGQLNALILRYSIDNYSHLIGYYIQLDSDNNNIEKFITVNKSLLVCKEIDSRLMNFNVLCNMSYK